MATLARLLPVDLVLVVTLVAVVATRWRPTTGVPVVRHLLGGAFLFFATGYALLAVLFPRSAGGDGRRGLRFGDRLLLSFGVSVTLLPLFAIVVGTVGSLSTQTVFGAVAVFGIVTVLGATVRRFRLPVDRRYRVPTDRWLAGARTFLAGGSALTTAVNLTLALAVLAGLSAGAYTIATPQPDVEYTEFALLTDNGTEYVSGNYPTNLTQGRSAQLTVSVENQRDEVANYSVVAELQRVQITDDDRIRILAQSEQARFSQAVEPGQTWYQPHRIRPQRAGDGQRLVYYLYRGDPPTDASAATADRQLQLWVNVSTGF